MGCEDQNSSAESIIQQGNRGFTRYPVLGRFTPNPSPPVKDISNLPSRSWMMSLMHFQSVISCTARTNNLYLKEVAPNRAQFLLKRNSHVRFRFFRKKIKPMRFQLFSGRHRPDGIALWRPSAQSPRRSRRGIYPARRVHQIQDPPLPE